MRILIAPDSFKGSLSAFEAAGAIEQGARRARPDAELELCPLSDGGEGVGAVLSHAFGGTRRVRTVTGPLGTPVDAEWWLSEDGETAIIESASAVGLRLVPDGERAPLSTTTRGVGELLLEAAASGAKRILVGLGGTATTDGGAGMAEALGVTFDGGSGPITGGRLRDVTRVNASRLPPGLAGVEIVVLTDVDAPLAGPQGSPRVYAPQKGASPADVEVLDLALTHLAALVGDDGTSPGDGAAGGLGYGLRVFAGARLQSGIDAVLDAVGFDSRFPCDLVLTGAGRLDGQSAHGKVLSGVTKRCVARHVPVIALVGSIAPGADALLGKGLTAAFSLCSGPMTESDAERDAVRLLERLAEHVVRACYLGQRER